MANVKPDFIRLPEPKTFCPYTGYSRTGLYNLTVPCKANQFRPPVPAKCDKKTGNVRGIWLIPYQALVDYINALPTPGLLSASQAECSTSPEAGSHAQRPGANASGRLVGKNCPGVASGKVEAGLPAGAKVPPQDSSNKFPGERGAEEGTARPRRNPKAGGRSS